MADNKTNMTNGKKLKQACLSLKTNSIVHFTKKKGQFATLFLQEFRHLETRYRLRFFDQVGHQNIYASIGNKHLFTKSSDLPKS